MTTRTSPPKFHKRQTSRRPARKTTNLAEKHDSQETNTLKIIPLGGQEEVGRNMTVFEYGKDIVILDMGIQFPEENMPGIDYIIPNTTYLQGKEKNIRAVIFSHGHLDHIGAAPILLKKLDYPLVIGRNLTVALIRKRLEDYEKNSVGKLRASLIKSAQDKIQLGNFKLSFFEVEHSIMDAVGIILQTPVGTIIHPGDWTMYKTPDGKEELSYKHLASLPGPKILMLESLGATDNRLIHTTETEMYANLEKLIREANGKVIIGTFSSQIKRIGHILEYARTIGKKVALDGFSMKANIEIAKELGYIKIDRSTMIPVNDINKYPENKVIVVCTGAQGEGNAVLSRVVASDHRFIKIRPHDTIIFSSSVIPGNERTIQRLKDNLYRQCDNVIHSDIMDVHTSGHCHAENIKEILRQIKPDYFLPVYANHFILKEAAKLALSIGMSKSNVFILDNGSVLEFSNQSGPKLHAKKIPTNYVFVDGLGVGDVGEVVLRDRQTLAEDGMFVIIAVIDRKTGKIQGSPDIISRGFVYLRESKDLLRATRRRVIDIIDRTAGSGGAVNWIYVKEEIRNKIGDFLYQQTERRPMVLPVVIEV
ncbi:ribonuclease J [Candidatus Parcubacteria bacterium]|nr:ribonuclease J [Patescibacteria group bacterium]MCG2688595.1 ribonuclease J [Candidatus Parcubacteria bacterium]